MPACLPLLLLSPSPYIPPHGAQPRPLPLPLPPCLAAVVRPGCCTTLRRRFPSIIRHARRPSVLPSANFSFRRARRSGYFVPFCRPITCLPYSLHADGSARRYTQRKQAYSQSCAPYLPASVSIFYTLKKSFAFYKKNLQKSLHISKILTTFAHVRWKIKHLTRSLRLLYIYIGKIKSPQPVAASCGRREGKTLHLLTLSGAKLAILFVTCKFGAVLFE